MLRLLDAGNYMTFVKKSNNNLKTKAFQVLKQKALLKKMSNSFKLKYNKDLIRKVWSALIDNASSRYNYRKAVKRQIDLQREEDDFDILRNCFNRLKFNRYLKKAS